MIDHLSHPLTPCAARVPWLQVMDHFVFYYLQALDSVVAQLEVQARGSSGTGTGQEAGGNGSGQ